MKLIDRTNLADFILGTAILGTGGGGDPYVGRLMLEQELAKTGPIDLLEPSEVPNDLRAISVFSMGAPTVFSEKLPNADSTVTAVRRIEGQLGCEFNAIIPLEAGGLNATLPLVVAAKLGLPAVDADGMGRAFPEVQMTTFNIYGVKAAPLAAVDDHGNCVLFETDSAIRAERYSRPVCVQMGGISQMAAYPICGTEIRSFAVPRTVTLAIEIGRTVRVARTEKVDPGGALVEYFARSNPPRFSRILFDGKVRDVERNIVGGFTVGKLDLEAADSSGDHMTVSFQNEFCEARRNGCRVAVVPDLIMVLDRESGEPIMTEALKYGQRIMVLGVAAAQVMRSAQALAILGPRSFGLADPFQPLEEVHDSG